MRRSATSSLIVPALLMIGIFGLVQFNRIGNFHYHIDEGGFLFSHSHPYDKSSDSGPVKTHGNGKCHLVTPAGSTEITLPADACVTYMNQVNETPRIDATVQAFEEPEIYSPGGRSPPPVANI